MLLIAVAAHAQVASSATSRQFSVTAGGMASIFQPDFEGDWQPPNPVAHASPYPLIGAGAYVDVKLSRWVQLEAEGRWLRFNQYGGINQDSYIQNGGISQDNYLIGPRLPLFHFWRSSVYAKALGGGSKMNFGLFLGKPTGHGSFTALAFGGGMDVKLTKRLSLRALDVEYQYWPLWSNSTLSPYGASVGMGYRIF
ncbi:MAG: outer membrane beta-barrel protein [Terracidiphilus sp.]|jgi:opacity protein-like surface antigen